MPPFIPSTIPPSPISSNFLPSALTETIHGLTSENHHHILLWRDPLLFSFNSIWFSIAFITYFVALPRKGFYLIGFCLIFLPNCTLNNTELLVGIVLFALYSCFQIITLCSKPLCCGHLGIFRSALPSQKISVIFPRVVLSNRLNTMKVIHLPHLPLSYFISALQNIFL